MLHSVLLTAFAPSLYLPILWSGNVCKLQFICTKLLITLPNDFYIFYVQYLLYIYTFIAGHNKHDTVKLQVLM